MAAPDVTEADRPPSAPSITAVVVRRYPRRRPRPLGHTSAVDFDIGLEKSAHDRHEIAGEGENAQ
jgi:hypothetical protein